MNKHTQKRVRLHSFFLSFQFVLAEVCFVMMVFGVVLTVNRTNNTEAEAAQLQTVSWSPVTYRHQVCLAGTSQCQPFKTTSGTSASWTVASLVNYDFHVDISSNGTDWRGWDHQTNKGKNCFGPATCSYVFTWPKVDYKVSTTLDGNVEHIVSQPTTSYTYSNVGYGVVFTGVVKFNDLGNFGSSRVHTYLSGTTAAQSWVLTAPAKNGGDVVFTFSPAIGTGASLIVTNPTTNAVVKDSGALTSGSSSYIWTDAPAGTYKAVLFYYPNAISNEVVVRVDRKAVMEKSEPRCGNTGWPNNVIVRHEWKPASGTFSSQVLQVSTNSSFSSNLQQKSISSSTKSYELSGYGGGKSYYARIKSVTNDGRTIYSRVQGFHTMDCPNTGLEIPLPTSVSGLPACVDGVSSYGVGITLNWNTVTGATSYTVRLTKDVNTGGDYATKTVSGNSAGGSGSWKPGGNPLVTWVNGDNLNLLPGETYFFAVSASNGSVDSGYNLAGRSLQVGPVPVCSTAVVPPTPTGVDGVPICEFRDATFGGNLNFKWTAVEEASSYTVRLTINVNTGGDFATKTVTVNSAGGNGGWDTGGNSLVTWVSGGNLAMKPGVKYFYSVMAVVGGVGTNYDLTGKSMQVGPVYYCVGDGADGDGDGFSDSAESYIGTSASEKCGTNAFPPDINGDGRVSSIDLGQLAQSVASSEGDEKYDRRVDLNADKKVNSLDQALLARYFGIACQTLGVKTEGEVKAATTPGGMRIGAPACSDAPFWVYAGWDNPGDYWIDFTWDGWATSVSKHLTNSNLTGIPGGYGTPGGSENPFYVLFPGRSYQWRLWNGSQHFYGSTFTVGTCTMGVGAEYREIHDYIYGVGSNIYTDLPVGNSLSNIVLTRVELGKFLWGLAGCETGRTWDPYTKNEAGNFHGLYQFSPSSWSSVLSSMKLPTSISIYDPFVGTHAVIHQIVLSHDRIAMFNSQWPKCSFIWNTDGNSAGW